MKLSLLVALAAGGTVAAQPTTCYTGCDDNGAMPSGGYLDNACMVETCASTDTHCLSVYSTEATHFNSLNPITGAMDAIRGGQSTTISGRVTGLGCSNDAKEAVHKAKFDQIYTGLTTGNSCREKTKAEGRVGDSVSGDATACGAVTDVTSKYACEAQKTAAALALSPVGTVTACTYVPSVGYAFDKVATTNGNKCQIVSTNPIATAKKCKYGSFGNDWKMCGDISCMETGALCMDIKFSGQWGGTWRSGMGCQSNEAAGTATCDEWKHHKNFVKDSCSTCDPNSADGDNCNVCVSDGMQTKPSTIVTGLSLIAIIATSAASMLSMA